MEHGKDMETLRNYNTNIGEPLLTLNWSIFCLYTLSTEQYEFEIVADKNYLIKLQDLWFREFMSQHLL